MLHAGILWGITPGLRPHACPCLSGLQVCGQSYGWTLNVELYQGGGGARCASCDGEPSGGSFGLGRAGDLGGPGGALAGRLGAWLAGPGGGLGASTDPGAFVLADRLHRKLVRGGVGGVIAGEQGGGGRDDARD